MTTTFREITISGTPDERGNAHGAALAAEIESTIDFYAAIFKKSPAEIFDRAKHFRSVIRDYNPAYGEEIEGIAAGARIKEPLWIYALNSRSELLALDASIAVNECTAVFFNPTAILGQNWDWGRPLEKLVVLMQIEFSGGHKIQMLTEPGIIGKIGLNSDGIGACLNILRINRVLDGVPIHIVLRSVLESRSIEGAKAVVQSCGKGKASNILFGDSQGNCYDVEFAGDESFLIQSSGHFMIHTNHYLARPINPNQERFRCSYSRLEVAAEKAAALSEYTVASMQTILTDCSDGEFPICRKYASDPDVDEMGTVAMIVMDLPSRKLHIRKSNPLDTAENKFKVAFES